MNVRTMMTTVVLAMVAVSGCLRPADDGKPDAGGGAGGGTALTATLELTPGTLTIPLGSTATVRVTQVQPDGASQDVTATAELRAEPEGVVTISQGTVRGVAAGSVILIAKLNQLEARASVVVPQASVRSIEVSVTEPTVAKGSLFTAAALATLTDGSLLDVSSTAQWSVENPQDVEEVLRLVGPGLVLARNGGTARVKATVGALTGFAEVIVRDVQVVSLMVTPGMSPVPVNSSLQLSAVARYSDGTDVDVSRAVEWSSSAPTFTIDASGLALAKSAGSATLTATLDGQTATAMLTATDATPTQLTFMPGSLNLGVRASAPFRVVASFSDGSSADVTAQASFTSSRPAVASVSTSGVRGVVSALSAGSADITARFGTASATAPVTVTAAALQAVELTPRTVTISGSGVVLLRARGTYSDGSQSDVTDQAIWSSADAAIAFVSNAAGSRGQVRGLNGGSTVVSALLGGLRAQADITVQAATLTSIELAPAMVSVEAGLTTQLRVIAWYSDNTTRDVTTQAIWTSLTPMVATVSNASGSKGLVRALVDGSASIQVTVQGQTAMGTVTVQPPTLTQLSISPGAMSVPLGLPAGFAATAAYSDGSAIPVTEQVSWTSSNPAVAEVLISQGYAYLDSKQAGTIVITATMAGVAPARATVTVTTATLSRIDVTPARPMLPVGAYVELNASGIYSDLTTQYLRYAVSWTSSDPSVATVGNTYQDKGFVTALRSGTTTITATYNGVSSTTLLTVTSATLTQLQVTPFSPRLPIGFDTNLRATGLYSDNSTRDLTYAVSWTSNAPGTASIGLYADLQPIQAGTATITATYGAVQGTTLVTVTSATLSSVVIGMPSSMPLAVQATRQLTARGTFSDGSMMDVTPYVTWLSSTPAIASVSNAWPSNGEVKGLSAGMATITAVRGSVVVTSPIQVQ
ncbi:MAG: Ig-like domain-containing protein [Myxococcales bacterium]|nr:Ig-like domain-containing protein [Myxococcales bacterium]